MKKLKAFAIILISVFPLILNAENNEETKWRWYTYIEENAHYESDVENSCEYFDKSNYVLGPWQYSLTKPEEKDNREINEIVKELTLDISYINILKIRSFEANKPLKIYEFDILDKNGESVDYKITGGFVSLDDMPKISDNDLETYITVSSYYEFRIEFLAPQNIKELTIKMVYESEDIKGINFGAYISESIRTDLIDHYMTNVEKNCEGSLCTMNITAKLESINTEELIIRTNIYEYRDTYYKCYTKTKLYVPGYYKDLEGFIKDEEDFITEKIDNNNETITANQESNVIYLPYINEDKSDSTEDKLPENEPEEEKDETINKTSPIKNEQIAMVTKIDETAPKSVVIYKVILILFFIALALIVTKKVVKSRTK